MSNSSTSSAAATTDYIVVGAGSSGAVVAARLSEDPNVTVTLIEAGQRERNLMLNMPIAFPMVMSGGRYNWQYSGEKEPHADDRCLRQPRGKGLGGSSLINGMLYARGHARDYDEWRQLGLEGWSYDDVLPFFKKSEDHWGEADEYHGKGGPLSITKHIPDKQLFPRFIDAVKSLGYKTQADHHGADQEGWGSPDMSIHKGWRGSTASRFLYPAMKRPNLRVITGALATRVEVENGRATALHYQKNGRDEVIRAGREIVLSGGAFNSPQLLLLSGIGPADELKELGIDVVHHLAGVGRNLQDHPSVALVNKADRLVTLTDDLRFDRLTLSVLQWMATGKGRISNMPVTANGFIKTRPDLERPDAQCLFQPTSIIARPWFPGVKAPAADVVAMACVLLRPESRGWVKLASSNPQQPPRILSNVLGTENDKAFFRRVVPQIQKIFATSPLAEMIGDPIMPPAGIEDDEAMDAWVRQAVNTAMHPVGSCAMGVHSGGQNDAAVCDAQLRVHGIDGLRVADASIMPRIVGGNTNAAAIMIGEKAADMIKASYS